MYAIALVDYDQDSNEVCKDLLKTKDGIDCLAQYSSSVGRYFHILVLSCIAFAIFCFHLRDAV